MPVILPYITLIFSSSKVNSAPLNILVRVAFRSISLVIPCLCRTNSYFFTIMNFKFESNSPCIEILYGDILILKKGQRQINKTFKTNI